MRPPALAPQGDTPLAGGEECQDERRNVSTGTEVSGHKSCALPGIGQLDMHAPEIGTKCPIIPSCTSPTRLAHIQNLGPPMNPYV